MKKYRIQPRGYIQSVCSLVPTLFVVQRRIWLFFWRDEKVCTHIKDAERYIINQRRKEIRIIS